MTENIQQEYNIHQYVTWDTSLKKKKRKKDNISQETSNFRNPLWACTKSLAFRRSRTISKLFLKENYL